MKAVQKQNISWENWKPAGHKVTGATTVVQMTTAQYSTIGAHFREGTTPGGDPGEQVLSFDRKKMLQIARHFPGWQVTFTNTGNNRWDSRKGRISPEPSSERVALNNELQRTASGGKAAQT